MTDEIVNEEEVARAEAPAAEDEVAEAEAMHRAARGDSKKKLRRVEAELAEAKKALEAKETELAELNDRYLRLAAEYDNFRRRTQKERENIYADALEEALAAFLPVLDNLERAAMYNDGESVAKGLAMTLKGIADSLEKLGITEIEALGKTFDPLVHNAVLHVEDEAYGEGEIVEVLQKGYKKGDRVLRYAMVKVAN